MRHAPRSLACLVALAGLRHVYGGSGLVMGPLDEAGAKDKAIERMKAAGFGNVSS